MPDMKIKLGISNSINVGKLGLSPAGVATAAPFNPLTLSPMVWYDGADATKLYTDTGLTTLVTADNDSIRGLKDKSGNNIHATDVTGCVYKTGIQNGLSVIRGNGTSSKLVTAATNWNVAANADFWVTAVFVRRDAAAAERALCSFGSFSPMYLYASGGSNKSRWYRGADYVFDRIYSQNTAYIASSGRVSDVLYLIVNGVQDAQTPAAFTNAIGTVTLNLFSESASGGSYGQMDLCEFFFWNSKPSEPNLASLRTYLNTKWAVF